MGTYLSNYQERFDTLAHVLHYPQKPLVTTTMMKYLRSYELPSGTNAIVAIMCYRGYNQEDSLIFNKSALDRGLFRSTFYRTHVDQEKEIIRVGGLMEQFEIPEKAETKGIQQGNYGKLDVDGIIKPGSRAEENDIIIGKTTPIATNKQEISQMKKFKKRDVSTGIRPSEAGIVDKILITTNSDGFKYTKIKIRSQRIPEIGDKFCLTEDHDVLTTEGWIEINRVTTDHKVATLIDGKILSYDYPTEVVNFDHTGEMYEIDTNQVSLCTTMNHRMWVGDRNKKYKIEEAKDIIGKRKYYQKSCENVIVDSCKEIHNNKFRIFDDDKIIYEFSIEQWLIMFGIWLAEGYVYCKNNNYYVNFSTNKERVRNALDIVEKECGLNFNKSKNKKYDTELTNYRINNRQLAEYFNSLEINGAVNKDLPHWVWSLNKEQCKVLINGMMLGDGHTMSNGTRRYDTSSKNLANSLQRLCIHAGYSANVILKYKSGKKSIIKETKYRKEEIIISNYDAWRLTIIEHQNYPIVNKTKKQDKIIQFEGKVYCCTVPSGIMYVRRNNKPVWTGNSSRHGLNTRELSIST
jgi:hypothetical protein